MKVYVLIECQVECENMYGPPRQTLSDPYVLGIYKTIDEIKNKINDEIKNKINDEIINNDKAKKDLLNLGHCFYNNGNEEYALFLEETNFENNN